VRHALYRLGMTALIATALPSGEIRAQSQSTFLDIDMITTDVSPQALGQEKPQVVGQSPLILVQGAVGGWFVRAMTRSEADGSLLGNVVDIALPPSPCLPPNPCRIMYSEQFMPGQVFVLGDDGAMVVFPISILPDGTPQAGSEVCFPPNPIMPDLGPACAIAEIPGSAYDDGMPRLYVGTQSGMIVRFFMPMAGEILLDEVIDLLAGHPIDQLAAIPQARMTALGIGTGIDIYGLLDAGMVGSTSLPAVQFMAFNPEGVPVRAFDVMPDPSAADGPVHIVFGDGEHARVVRATIPSDASGTFAMTEVPPNPVWPLLSSPPRAVVLGSLLLLTDDGQGVWFDPGYDVLSGFSGCLADVQVLDPATCVECAFTYTGDVNDSKSITSADIIYLVNFIFKSGPDPLPCPGNGDVNCSYSVNSADIIYLVNWVFKGGLAICDECQRSWVCW
jgi:hypothetical protein